MTYYGASELTRSFRVVRNNLIKTAEDIPEDKYDFRPTPESMSVREILAHLLVSSQKNRETHAVRKITTFVGVNFPALMKERKELEAEWNAASKTAIVEAFTKDADDWSVYLSAVSEADLSVVVPFSPPAEPREKSRLEMLLSVKEHEMHHRAQLMVYERLLGIVPHLTRDRQARMAAMAAKQG